MAFLRHQEFPMGPILLRDLLGTRAGREQKTDRIQEVLDLHPPVPFVLIGDSGEKDPRSTPTSSRPTPDEFSPCTSARYGSTQGTVALSRSPAPGRATVPFVLAGQRRRTSTCCRRRPALIKGRLNSTRRGPEDAKTLACLLHRSGAHRLGVSDGT